MKTIIRSLSLAAIIIGLTEVPVIAYRFGSDPLDDVRQAAIAYSYKCPGLSPDLLVAYMLTPTWWEVTQASPDIAPSPMTLSRYDTPVNNRLLPPWQGADGVVWHPGIGAWQLDDSGLGTKIGVERFNSRDSAMRAAQIIADKFCDSNHPSHDPLWMFHDWYGCAKDHVNYSDRDACVPTLQRLSDPSSNPVFGDPFVGRYGGTETRLCILPGQAVPFICYYVDPRNAQPLGNTWWSGNVSDALLPIARRFYLFSQSSYDGSMLHQYEWRYWIAADVSANQNFAARRDYGHNSRTDLCWVSATSGNTLQGCQLPALTAPGLCDITRTRGGCGGSTIWVTATLNGMPWPATQVSNPLSWHMISGPASLSSGGVPARFSGEPTGTYTIEYQSGGPAGAVLVNPTITKTLTAGGSVTFSFDFSTTGVCTGGLTSSKSCGSGPTCYSLTLSRNDPVGGSLPNAIPTHSAACGTSYYVPGENIQLTATPASGWSVGSWIGTGNDGSTSSTNSLVMPTADRAVVVNYVQPMQNGRPIVTTGNADGITATSASLHGLVNPNGRGTNVYFAYGTNVAYSVTASGSQYVGTGTAVVPFAISVANLSCATTYTYYAVGSNSAGASSGQWQTFTTSSCPLSSAPSVSGESADGITQTGAVLHASVNPNGLSTTAYFQYGTNPASPLTTTPQSIGQSTSAATIVWSVSGLSCGTNYNYNAVGTNTAGSSSGPWRTFTTLACNTATAPVISNEHVGSITAGGAILYAQVDPRGLRTDTRFQYGTNPAVAVETTSSLPISGLAELDQYIDGLSCATTYSYDAIASSSGGTTFGPWLTFTTGACGPDALPGAKDESVDGIGQISATFHVSVNPNGAVTGVYFQYGIDTSSLTATHSQLLSQGTSWQSVAESLPPGSLICGTTYYYQAVVYNNSTWQGVYLPFQVFKTVPCGQPGTAGWPIGLITGQADSITRTSALLHGSANPNGAPTTGFFILYPPYPAAGFTSSSVSIGASNTDQPFAVTVSGLSCGTRYDYLADAINTFGESNGAAFYFETAACSRPDSPTNFYTLPPCRILDTRNLNDPNHPAIMAGEVRLPVLVGKCGIPPTATAVSLNVTVVNPSAPGFLSLSPVISTYTSTINFGPGQVRANNAIIELSEAGSLAVFCGMASGAVDYILDVNGYFQ